MLRYYLVHHTYVRSHTQLSCGPYMLAIGSWRCSNESNNSQQQALAYHPEPPHKPQHELSALRVLCALCVPFLRTFSHLIRASQYTLILRNHLGAPARTTPGCSEIIESCTTRTQHLVTKQATTQGTASAQIQTKLLLILSKNLALLAITLTSNCR